MPRLRAIKPTPDGEPRGIACRRCACQHFYVVKVEHARGGSIRRLRECRHCGARFWTREKLS